MNRKSTTTVGHSEQVPSRKSFFFLIVQDSEHEIKSCSRRPNVVLSPTLDFDLLHFLMFLTDEVKSEVLL